MATATLESSSVTPTQQLAGKHLTFMLGHEHYGLPVLKVREIIRLCDITPVPQMPDYIKGVLNLRGKIVPVADLRIKFQLASVKNTDLTCIIVVQISMAGRPAAIMGLIVDGVEEVVNIAAADIEPTPDFGTALETDYILGIAKVKGAVKTLLDIDKVVTGVNPEELQSTATA